MLFGGVNNSSLLTEPCVADAMRVQVMSATLLTARANEVPYVL
jgi:hypothetical protein